jgi:PAS domain S-box-containing protein
MLSLLRGSWGRRRASPRAGSGDETDVALRVLFENGAAGISEVDLSTRRFVRVNRRFCEMMRRPANALLAMGPAEVIHPDDLARVHDEWFAAMKSTGQWDATVRHLGPSGEIIWVRLGVSLWKRDESGAPSSCIAVLQDVSDTVAITEQLRESEQLLRLGQQVAGLGSFTRDLATGEITASAGLREIFGMPEETTKLSTEDCMESVAPEDRARVAAAVVEAHAGHHPEVAGAPPDRPRFRALRHRRASYRRGRERGHRHRAGGRRAIRGPVQGRRHGALPRQSRRARRLALVRAGDERAVLAGREVNDWRRSIADKLVLPEKAVWLFPIMSG